MCYFLGVQIKQKDLVICGALLCLPLPPLRGYPATPQENNLGLSLHVLNYLNTNIRFSLHVL